MFTSKPSWIKEEVPGNDGAFWAPALVSSRIMYYSVAAFDDDDVQCIGLATATGTAPNLGKRPMSSLRLIWKPSKINKIFGGLG